MLVRDLDDRLPEVPAGPLLRWTTLTDHEIPDLRAINPTLSEAEIGRRLANWHECLLGWVGGSLAYYHWSAGGGAYLPYLGCRLDLAPTDYLIAETFTAPRFRRRGIHSTASLSCLHRARALGFTRLIGFVASWNTPSVLVARHRMGRTLVGTATCWHVGAWRLLRGTGAVKIGGRHPAFVTLAESRPPGIGRGVDVDHRPG